MDQRTRWQSGRLIDGWEAIDHPSGKLEDLLETIRNEIGTLERIAADESEWPAIPANYLIGRYRGYSRRLKAMANKNNPQQEQKRHQWPSYVAAWLAICAMIALLWYLTGWCC